MLCYNETTYALEDRQLVEHASSCVPINLQGPPSLSPQCIDPDCSAYQRDGKDKSQERRQVDAQLPEDRHCQQNSGCESAKKECRRRTDTRPVSLHALVSACEIDAMATDENDCCDSPIDKTHEGNSIGEDIGKRSTGFEL